MTLVAATDAADVLEAQLRFHLAAGVDRVLVTEHNPVVSEVVNSLALPKKIRLVPSGTGSGRDPQDELARLAAVEHGADWIIPVGDSEFWWPRGGTIAEVLARIAPTYGAVQALTRSFPPVPGEGFFAERMIYRLSAQAWLGDEGAPLRAARRYATRPSPSMRSEAPTGSPDEALRPLRGWYPLEVLCFRFSRAASSPVLGLAVDEYSGLCLDDGQIGTGLETGAIELDTRVRDALRTLDERRALEFPRPSLVESVAYAVDAAVLGEGEMVGAQGHLDALEARLAELEGNIAVRLERKLRLLIRRSRSSV